MVQFNLLPDVKLDYIKTRRSKHTSVVVAVMVSSVALTIFVLLFLVVNVVQKKHLNDLNKDITTYSNQLKNTPDLNKILTIQNQLNSLPGLHSDKPIASRLFGYLSQVTPLQVNISTLNIDLEAHTLDIEGTADQLSTVNKFVDTLKFTTFMTADKSKQGNAFSAVVLGTFSKTETGSSYHLSLKYDETIFKEDQEVTLTVPKIITTRSETEKPGALFQAQPTDQGGQ